MTIPRPYYFTVGGSNLRAVCKFEPREGQNPWDPGLVSLQEQAVRGRAGVVLLDEEPLAPARDLVIDGTILADDPDDFEAQLLTLRRFHGPKGRRDHVLVFGNQVLQQVTARFLGISGGPTSPQMLQSKVPVSLHYRALQPYAIDAADQVLGPSGAPIPIPLGVERSRGVTSIAFAGPAASVTVTYKTYGGTTRGSITATHGFVNLDVLAFDHDAQTVLLNGARAEQYVTSGGFFAFDPNDGDGLLSHWPTVETNHGSLTVTYRRVW